MRPTRGRELGERDRREPIFGADRRRHPGERQRARQQSASLHGILPAARPGARARIDRQESDATTISRGGAAPARARRGAPRRRESAARKPRPSGRSTERPERRRARPRCPGRARSRRSRARTRPRSRRPPRARRSARRARGAGRARRCVDPSRRRTLPRLDEAPGTRGVRRLSSALSARAPRRERGEGGKAGLARGESGSRRNLR